MEQKNLILAIVLSLGVVVGWSVLVEKRIIPGAPPTTTASSAQKSSPASTSEAATGQQPSEPAQATAPQPVETKAQKNVRKTAELETAEAQISIATQGAGIVSYRYRGPLGWVQLVVDPVPGLFATAPNLTFAPQKSDKPQTAVFETSIGKLRIRKEFEFKSTDSLSHLRLTFRNTGNDAAQLPAWALSLGPGLGTVPSEEKDNAKLWRAIGLFPPDEGKTQPKLERLKAGERMGPWRWLAVDNRYFLAAAFASPQDFGKVQMDPSTVAGKPAPFLRIDAQPALLVAGQEKSYDIPFYVGPKNFFKLQAIGDGLERSVNFGWFDTLGRWTLILLMKLHSLTGNYGWSIIILTVMIQLALFPLTFKSLKSMARMRKIQPEMAKLQQKFKDDPQRLNAEMMELYKAKGVNPMGGCLPMIAQMPIFVALFDALRGAWELHGAPWMFWIHDLSAHDPYYILPVIMGGVMYLQNTLNPAASMDPTQANMMKFMPLIFVFMFANFPAGLVLYWLTNSILSTLQQLALRKQLT